MVFPIFIAKLAAILYVCIGLGAMMNKKHFEHAVEDLAKNPGVNYLSAIFALIIGFLMVSSYNVWSWNWTVLVTILGWGALLKGAIRLLFPEFVIKNVDRFRKSKFMGMVGPACVILGLIFGYFGFVAV